MSAPFMQLYVADYLGDTRHLTTEQHGAYLLLLMTMWRSGGRLPNDARKLARITGCTASRWAKISAEVLAYFTADGEDLTNERLTFELEKASEKSIKRADAGSKGGVAKSLKTREAWQAIASDLPQHSSEPEPEPEVIAADVRGAGQPEPADDWPATGVIDALVAEIASPRLDLSKSPGLVQTSGRVAAWKRQGASWQHDVVPVIRAICAKVRGPPITSWKYFDAAIAQSIADNRKALELPEARSHERPHAPSAKRTAREANHDRALAGALAAARQRAER